MKYIRCSRCPAGYFSLRIPKRSTTFCGVPVPHGKRYVCGLQIERGEFADNPIFHGAGEFPLDCPLRIHPGKKEGGK